MASPTKTVTAEQRELLHWAASLGAITAPALALRIGVSIASARGKLLALERLGMLARSRLLTDHPALFTITRPGLRAGEIHGIDPAKVSRSGASHLATCALVAAALERCYPDHTVIGERELRLREREHGSPIASARLRWGEDWQSDLHRPDLVMFGPARAAAAPPVSVEVELTVKAPHRLIAICRAWARCRTIDGVLYLVTPETERALRRALLATHASEQIAVVALSSLPGYEAAR